MDILLCSPYKSIGSGNQHGGRECDDLQNWLHMKSHENPLSDTTFLRTNGELPQDVEPDSFIHSFICFHLNHTIPV